MQKLIESKLAKMLSCNLAKIVHCRWLQQSSNRENDLYVATKDDFVKALIQVYRYYQYLKNKHVGTSPRKEELMLRIAQSLTLRSGNFKALNVVVAKMPGT